MNPLTLRIILGLASSMPAIVSEIKKVEADAKGATTVDAKIKNVMTDIEQLITLAVKVL